MRILGKSWKVRFKGWSFKARVSNYQPAAKVLASLLWLSTLWPNHRDRGGEEAFKLRSNNKCSQRQNVKRTIGRSLTATCFVNITLFSGVFHGVAKVEEIIQSPAILFFFFFKIYFNWRLITLQYCGGFCHTFTWISHGYTCVHHPNPPSYLPPYPIPQGHAN